MAEQYNTLADFFDLSVGRPWVKKLSGTALSLPEEYRHATLRGDLYIEYLSLNPDAEGNIPDKNHVVFQVPFVEHLKVKNDNGRLVTICSARIAMDLTVEINLLGNIDASHLEEPYINMVMDKEYHPGTLYIKLLKYDGKSMAANKISKFTELKFTTLGEFTDFFAYRNLHRMSFLGYGNAWKGCRDFIMQSFLQMRLENKIAETDQDGQTLEENITVVYNRDGSSHTKLIDRGLFLSYNHIFPGDIKYETEIVEA